MIRVPLGVEHHSFTRTVELKLNPLFILPFVIEVECDLEPVIRPAGSKILERKD
jgi:hypothetical protein